MCVCVWERECCLIKMRYLPQQQVYYLTRCPIWVPGHNAPGFICWFRSCICCVLVYLASPAYLLFLYLFFLIYLLSYLQVFSFENRSGGCKRQPNLGLSCLSLFWVIVFCVPDSWLFCVVENLVICISLCLLYISVVVLLVLILFSQY